MDVFPPAIIGIKPSKLLPGEVGLFALRDLRKGTVICKAHFGGEKFFPMEVLSAADRTTQQRILAFCAITDDGFYCVPNINDMPISWHCNHSCRPNVGYDRENNLLLIRNVKAREELTTDYGFAVTEQTFKMECRCGSKHCRKIITGNDWKDPSYFKRNKKYSCW